MFVRGKYTLGLVINVAVAPMPICDDNCYMAQAVEARQPFLDYRLIEFGLSLPPKLKVHRGISKFLLRSAVSDFVPATRRRDLKKIGLNLPIDTWMRGALKPWLLDNIAGKHLPLYKFANYRFVQKLLKEHMSENANHSLKLWDLACTNHWIGRYFA